MKPVYRPLEDITYEEALRILESGTLEERRQICQLTIVITRT